MSKKSSKSTNKKSILQKIGLFFHDKKETTVVFWIAIIVFGFLSYTTFMQRQGFPNIDVPISVVSGTYFVDDKNKIDTQIVQPMSAAIAKLEQVKSISTQSSNFYYSVVVEFNSGTSSQKGNALVSELLESKKIIPQGATQEFRAIDAGR